MKKYIFTSLLIIFTFTAEKSFGWEEDYYFDPEIISPQLIVPPLNDKAEQAKETKQILQLQSKITKAQIAATQAENKMKSEDIALTLGKNITRENFPKTYTLLDKVKTNCNTVVQNAKIYWDTERPYLVNKKIKLLIESPVKNGAYPSGHTTCSRVWAEVLGQIKPEALALLRTRAKEIAHHRVLVGMHWPHDLLGGEQLALLIVGALQNSENFRDDLKEAKTEWK